jgi:uncharacterized membrane protein
MKKNTKYQIILAIFIISFLSSLMLSQGFACNTGCSVKDSRIADFIMDKEANGYGGAIIFGILSILVFYQIKKPTKIKKRIIHIGIIIGSAIAIYFIYLQIFILKAFCSYCMIIDVGLLINLTLVAFSWKNIKI